MKGLTNGPEVMLAALTPEELGRLAGFLLACGLMLAFVIWIARQYWKSAKEERAAWHKLTHDDVVARQADEEVDRIDLYNEAKQWGGEP
jgi:predicted negative regulator of RcsB-dependent stress response